MPKKAIKGEVITSAKSSKKTNASQAHVFKPMAGFFLLYTIAMLGLIFTLDGSDYDTLIERIFWVVITIGLAVGIRRHWPAMRQLIANRRAK